MHKKQEAMKTLFKLITTYPTCTCICEDRLEAKEGFNGCQ